MGGWKGFVVEVVSDVMWLGCGRDVVQSIRRGCIGHHNVSMQTFSTKEARGMRPRSSIVGWMRHVFSEVATGVDVSSVVYLEDQLSDPHMTRGKMVQ